MVGVEQRIVCANDLRQPHGLAEVAQHLRVTSGADLRQVPSVLRQLAPGRIRARHCLELSGAAGAVNDPIAALGERADGVDPQAHYFLLSFGEPPLRIAVHAT